MNYYDLTTTNFVELYETAPIKDWNLIMKFHLTYRDILYLLVNAYENVALAEDLYKLYEIKVKSKKKPLTNEGEESESQKEPGTENEEEVTKPKKQKGEVISYKYFLQILKEMETAKLIKSGTYDGKKVISTKAKGFLLMGESQTDVKSDRINPSSILKSEFLTRLHLYYRGKYGVAYAVTSLTREEKYNNVYSILINEDGKEAVYYHYLPINADRSETTLVKHTKELMKSADEVYPSVDYIEVMFIKKKEDRVSHPVARVVKAFKKSLEFFNKYAVTYKQF